MTAKKSKIKELNNVIRKKNEYIQELKDTINAKTRENKNIKEGFDGDLQCLKMYTQHVKKQFTKEFTWFSLHDNPPEQYRALMLALDRIDEIAKGRECQ
jgi:hypothetical protein